MICLLRQRNNKVIRQQKRNYETVFFVSFLFVSFSYGSKRNIMNKAE